MIVNPVGAPIDSRFPLCLPFVLAMECPDPTHWSNLRNFSDDPHDAGGRTMCGIIQMEYDSYRKAHYEPVQDVLLISAAEGWDIYQNYYWEPKCDLLPPGLDLSFFDTDVNCGSFGAIKILQSSLHVAVDGAWGPITQGAVQGINDVRAAITSFAAARGGYYRSLRDYVYFGTGWMNRTVAIEQDSLSMTESLRGIRIARPYVKSVKAY